MLFRSLIPVWRAHVCFYSTCAHKERKIFVSLRALTVRKFCSVTLWCLKGVMSRHLVTKSGFCRGLSKSKREESHLIHVTNGRRNVSSLLFAGTLGRLKSTDCRGQILMVLKAEMADLRRVVIIT